MMDRFVEQLRDGKILHQMESVIRQHDEREREVEKQRKDEGPTADASCGGPHKKKRKSKKGMASEAATAVLGAGVAAEVASGRSSAHAPPTGHASPSRVSRASTPMLTASPRCRRPSAASVS